MHMVVILLSYIFSTNPIVCYNYFIKKQGGIPIMKRTPASFRFLSALVALLLVLSMIPLSVSAEEAADLYTPAADGDLLYTVNFAGDEYYQPEPLIGNNKVEVSNLDSTVATFDAGTDQLDTYAVLTDHYISVMPLTFDRTNLEVFRKLRNL
jgi:hypothetical protein